jgi:hypothetical protein
MSMLTKARSGRLIRRPRPIRIVLLWGAILFAVGAGGCHHVLHLVPGREGPQRPPAEAFGTGPRMSDGGLYQVGLETGAPLRPREMRTIQVHVRSPGGVPVEAALVSVDGGMPEHGHGLPTRPRAVPNGAPGVHDIEGLRFNMGGWWELRLTVAGPGGTDSVTFHLDL